MPQHVMESRFLERAVTPMYGCIERRVLHTIDFNLMTDQVEGGPAMEVRRRPRFVTKSALRMNIQYVNISFLMLGMSFCQQTVLNIVILSLYPQFWKQTVFIYILVRMRNVSAPKNSSSVLNKVGLLIFDFVD
jgi:hypothetical protein